MIRISYLRRNKREPKDSTFIELPKNLPNSISTISTILNQFKAIVYPPLNHLKLNDNNLNQHIYFNSNILIITFIPNQSLSTQNFKLINIIFKIKTKYSQYLLISLHNPTFTLEFKRIEINQTC